MPNEVSVHVQEYGFGGSFFEDEFFDTDDDEDEDNIKPMMKPEWGDTVSEMYTNSYYLSERRPENSSVASVQTSRLTSSEYCGGWIENCLVFWFSRKHHKLQAEQFGQTCYQKWQSIVSKNVHESQISSFLGNKGFC